LVAVAVVHLGMALLAAQAVVVAQMVLAQLAVVQQHLVKEMLAVRARLFPLIVVLVAVAVLAQ
jgi:hypothetical protein